MDNGKKTTTRRSELRNLIDRAVQPGIDKYKGTAGWVYAYGLVRELLIYSALNQFEIWRHLERLAERKEEEKTADEPRTKVKK